MDIVLCSAARKMTLHLYETCVAWAVKIENGFVMTDVPRQISFGIPGPVNHFAIHRKFAHLK